MAGTIHKKLAQLNPCTKNATITALILTKSIPNYFFSKDSNDFRGVINFTLRDSKLSICNCKYWGSKEKVDQYNRKFKIGDIISVVCPDVEQIARGGSGSIFMPAGTLPLMLVVNESSGSLASLDYTRLESFSHLQELIHISHKPLSSVLNLADVRYSAALVNNAVGSSSMAPQQFADLLVMVGLIRPIKNINRNGEDLQCLEVVVFDQSKPDGMILSIWHTDWILRAQQYWQSMKTILHLIDVRVTDSAFHKCNILRLSLHTLIYENPVGREADDLRKYALSMEAKYFAGFAQDHNSKKLPKPDEIRTQMTVKQIYTRLEGHLKDDSEEFTAVLYAMVTKFDIDGSSNVVGRKCKSCQRILSHRANFCEAENCQLAFSLNHCGDRFDLFYNINIHFGDHTGTLVEARLTGDLAEEVMQMSPYEFKMKDAEDDDKTLQELKWLYLLNHFEVKLLIRKVTAVRRQPAILVIRMQRITNIEELASKIVVF